MTTSTPSPVSARIASGFDQLVAECAQNFSVELTGYEQGLAAFGARHRVIGRWTEAEVALAMDYGSFRAIHPLSQLALKETIYGLPDHLRYGPTAEKVAADQLDACYNACYRAVMVELKL